MDSQEEEALSVKKVAPLMSQYQFQVNGERLEQRENRALRDEEERLVQKDPPDTKGNVASQELRLHE